MTNMLRRTGCDLMCVPAGVAMIRSLLRAQDRTTPTTGALRGRRHLTTNLRRARASMQPPPQRQGRLPGRRSRRFRQRRQRCNLSWARGLASANPRHDPRSISGGFLRERQRARDRTRPTAGTSATVQPGTRTSRAGATAGEGGHTPAEDAPSTPTARSRRGEACEEGHCRGFFPGAQARSSVESG